MNDEQSGSIEPPLSEPNADDDFFHQARKIEHDMHAIMTRQLRLAVVQVVLGILSITAGIVIAALG